MSVLDDGNAPIRILCFDAGGPGTYSFDVLLKEITRQLASELGSDGGDALPCNHFELMAGAGFGGLFALFLGHLKMSVNQATDSLLDVVTAVFPDPSEEQITPESRTSRLKRAVEGVLESTGLSVTAKMYEEDEPSPKCKVVLYSATSALINHPYAMRNYGSRGATINPTIVEAVCATSFVGPPQGAHNPTREAFKEAKAIYGADRRVAQILSLGCGQHRATPLDKDHPGHAMARLVSNMAIDCKSVADDLAQRLVDVDAYLRLSVTLGIENTPFKDWAALGDIRPYAQAYVATATVHQVIKLSAFHMKERIGSVTLQQLNEFQPIRVMAKRAPVITPYFVERPEVSGVITHHLTETAGDKQRILPITGIGGCGKTQMVSHILQMHRVRFKHQIYTDASSLSSLRTDLQNWMRAKGTGYEQATWEEAIAHLSGIEGWVLVFDNADDRSLNLVPYFPKCHHGFIFITSRNHLVGNLSTTTHIELGCMSPDEAMSALLGSARRSEPLPPDEQKDAENLIGELGHLPLAIIQAGSYCHQLTSTSGSGVQPFTFTQYGKLLKSHRPRLLREAQMASLDQYERSVYSTLELSCLQLAPKDLELLRVVCNFDCSDVSLRVLEIAAGERFRDPHKYMERPEEHRTVLRKLKELLTQDRKWDDVSVQKMVENLSSFSILTSTSVHGAIYINVHPLVQAFVCDAVDAAGSRIMRQMSTQILTACDVEKAVVVTRLAPSHIRHVIEMDHRKELHTNTRMAFASTMRECGYWELAERLGKAACQELVTAKGKENLETIRAVENLASTYHAQGKWGKAEGLRLEVLDKRRRLLPEDHPDTIKATSNLAATYHAQEKWDKAEGLRLEVLEKRRRLLPQDHPDTLSSACDLAITYNCQQKWQEAFRVHGDIVPTAVRILGPSHPEVRWHIITARHYLQGIGDTEKVLEMDELLSSL